MIHSTRNQINAQMANTIRPMLIQGQPFGHQNQQLQQPLISQDYLDYLAHKKNEPDPLKMEIERLNTLIAEMQNKLTDTVKKEVVEVVQPKTEKKPIDTIKAKTHLSKLIFSTLALTFGSVWMGNFILAHLQPLMWGGAILLIIGFLSKKQPKTEKQSKK